MKKFDIFKKHILMVLVNDSLWYCRSNLSVNAPKFIYTAAKSGTSLQSSSRLSLVRFALSCFFKNNKALQPSWWLLSEEGSLLYNTGRLGTAKIR
jgi:hypothetical protein